MNVLECNAANQCQCVHRIIIVEEYLGDVRRLLKAAFHICYQVHPSAVASLTLHPVCLELPNPAVSPTRVLVVEEFWRPEGSSKHSNELGRRQTTQNMHTE